MTDKEYWIKRKKDVEAEASKIQSGMQSSMTSPRALKAIGALEYRWLACDEMLRHAVAVEEGQTGEPEKPVEDKPAPVRRGRPPKTNPDAAISGHLPIGDAVSDKAGRDFRREHGIT